MSFREVETLFHEFGHSLQHMMTTVDYPQAAGINNVEWDAVDTITQVAITIYGKLVLSQGNAFSSLTEHVDSGEQLP